jgi:alginate O-acetyltransferase complex protein AlgI
MLFNTLEFWLFFSVVYGVYLTLDLRGQNIWLLAASYVFYSFWDYRFVFLIVLSTSADWLLARRIARERMKERARKWVAMSVALNLAFLGVFKYFNFFAESLGALLETVGWRANIPTLEILRPVGISFYTFQSMSYIVDVYRRDVEPSANIVDFALFVAFIPHMVAGPIMRASVLLPQVERPRSISFDDVSRGFHLAMVGLFKKVVIADNLAPIVEVVFSRELGYRPGVMHLGALAFAFQIYADFSGYSDIARGTARMMGFTLMENFDAPYFATSITDFWRRWHISLSTWLREYLYIPLGGGRGTRLETLRNLMMTMILGGLWHGASFHYVVWGAYQGVLLAIERIAGWVRPRVGSRSILVASLKGLATFHLVCLGWIFFRAVPGSPLILMARQFLNPAGWLQMPVAPLLLTAVIALPLVAYDLARRVTRLDLVLLRLAWPLRGALYASLAYVFLLCGRSDAHAFIYFQF